jgi:hypothetical protein
MVARPGDVVETGRGAEVHVTQRGLQIHRTGPGSGPVRAAAYASSTRIK